MLEEYVEIMQLRYPNLFSVEFDAQEELDNIELPRMLVQPIVENAISHGLLTKQNGRLYISAKRERNYLIFSVKDNGIGIPKERLEKLQKKIQQAPNIVVCECGIEHIALLNIQKRIYSMFGDSYGITIDSILGEGTKVTLKLPIRKEYDLTV